MADFFKGLSYFGKKLGTGFLRSVEGLVDFTVGGVADLFGADEFAEKMMADDWIDYNAPDREFGETEGFWKVAGDIGGGIGSSLPSLALSFIPGAGPALSIGMAGLGAAGTATSEAYKETGELDADEWIYGATSGGIEAGIEAVTMKLGAGIEAAGSSIGKRLARESAENAGKTLGKETAKTLASKSTIKAIVGDMLSEGFEEGVTEWIDPYIKRATYDPNAENATAQEIGYAALIGALSGGITTGATRSGAAAVNLVRDTKSGRSAVEKGEVDEIILTSRVIADNERNNSTGYDASVDVLDALEKLDKSLEKTGGKVTTAEQQRLVGRLKRGNVTTVASSLMYDSVRTILSDPETFVARFNEYGMRGADGKVINLTSEELMRGVDTSSAKGIMNGLKENGTLRYIAAMDAAGKLMLDTAAMQKSILRGETEASERWLASFYENASDEEMYSLSRALGVDMKTATTEEILRAAKEYRAIPENAAVQEQISEAKKIASESAKTLPKRIAFAKDGIRRYKADGLDIAVMKSGDTYRIYEYDTGDVSRALSVDELNRTVRDGVKQAEARVNVVNTKKTDTERKLEAERIDTLLSENVQDYREISAPAKTMVRKVYREALAKGLTEVEALTYARISAHSGLNITFSKTLCRTNKRNADGSVVYADGYYSESQNRIVVNPEGTRSVHDVLIHELDHAIRKSFKGKTSVYMREVFSNLTEDERQRIINDYKGVKTDSRIDLLSDEFNAYFAEKCLKNRDLQSILFDKKPSVLKRIVDFFTGAKTVYSDDPKLSRAAKWYETRYRKMFEDLSTRNRGRNAVERVGESRETRFALIGRTEDGRGIYRSNYPKNTPKAQKQKDIIDLVQNVWSEKPIKLDLVVNGQIIPIEANFNPELTERSDLSKIAFGNRKGTNSEKRITLDLSSDLYQIAEESHHVGSKIETGKDNPAHFGVSEWHYFLTNLVFVEDDGTNVDCYMNIDVKQNGDGHWFYSFAIEKGTAPRTLLAGVTDKSATVPTNSIPNPDEKVNTSDKKYLEAVKNGDMQTAQRMVDEAAKKAGYGVKAYHGTNADFTVFDKSKIGSGATLFASNGAGFYFTENENVAKGYSKAEKVLSTYLKLEKPFVFVNNKNTESNRVLNEFARKKDKTFNVSDYNDYKDFEKRTGSVLSRIVEGDGKAFTAFLEGKGYDGIEYTSFNYDTNKSDKTYVVFNSSQIKSAAPVTYDDNGNIIPLSERFNPEIDDIRWALPMTDSDGNPLSQEQQEYFKDSKVRDENGNLLALYHGTPKENGEFYVFDNNKAKRKGGFGFASSGKGFYFTTKREAAEVYTRSGGRLLSVYVDIKNPYIVNGDIKEQISNDFGIDPLNVYLQEVRRILSSKGYDGIIQGKGDARIVVAYYPEQIKLTSNKNPTSAPDIRYALPENDSTGAELTSDQRKYFDASKQLDSEGRLQVMYQGAPEEFFTFDKKKSKASNLYGRGFYFTNSADQARHYGTVRGYYLNITNPLSATKKTISRMQMRKFLNAVAENEDYSIENYGTYDVAEVLRSVYEDKSDFAMLYDVSLTAIGDLVEAVELFNKVNGTEYDGFILDTESVIFRSEQAKLTFNTAPSSNPDTRYALTYDEDLDAIFGDIDMNADADGASFDIDAVLERGIPMKPGASTLTIGEMKKTIANNTHYQVFSKGKALEVIGRMFGTSDLTSKTRAKLADALWQGFNDCTDLESRQTFAHDMAEFIVATMVTEAKVENPDVMEAQERLSYLSTYIGKISFHPEYLSEIRHIADKAGLKKILGRWGYKGKKGTHRVPMDVFAVDIAREMPGMSELEDMHPVEAFMELDAMYERAREDVKDKWISAYWGATDADMIAIVSGIEADIMRAFETEGEQSKFSRLVEGRIEYYSTRAEFWKAEHDRIKGRDRILGLLMSQAQKMKDLRLGTFANATQFDSELFKNSIEKLAKIQFRGNLNVSGTRKIMGELLQWYRKDNPLLEFVDDKNPGLYVQSVADMLESLSEGKKGFSKEELLTMYDVMSYFVKFVENYGKVFRNGKMIEALPEAKRYIGIAQANEGLKVGLFAKLSGSWYAEMFSDPATLVRRMDYYERGFYTEMFEDLREAATDAEIAEMRIMREYDEFLRSNKKYIEKASEELIEYRGQKIPKIQLIDLYMTMKRKHAWAGIAINGFPFKNLEGKVVRVPGFLPDEHISETDLEAAITAQQAEIAKHFTDADRQYMAILEKGYNEDARKLKADRDMQRLGFTNASTDYYYPIRRAYTAQNIDTSDAQAEYDRVTNSSFNKDIVKGAKQEIAIESADTRFRRHIHAVCQYAYLSPAIETFNRLYNMDISGNRNHPISVRTASENVWAKGNKYFMKLISDIQGIPTGSSEGISALSFIRGSYAKFQLGANPKVWFTQLSSIFASSSLLDADCITRGAFLSSKGIDEYCPLAELRSYDNTAAMAQGVLDKQGKARSKAGRAMGKVGKFSDLLMQPIGMMDRFVVCRIFGACQAQVEKNGGAKVGTEANKIEAGKLLRKVILETQQNSIATERSAAMRSGNEILRTVTMFTSDSMKVVGRVVDAFGEISVLHSKIKAATDPDVKAELKARLKVAKRNARKATTALVMTAVFMAGIAQLFRWLYDKEQKEDETVAQTMIVDAAGNLFGGLPLIKDVYARIFEGYDFDNYAYSSINDLLDSAINLFDTASSIIGGEASSQDVARGIKNLTYSVGQLTGLPVRNVYNVFYGLTKRFSPETAYKIDSAFYAKNYQNDLYKAIDDEDAEMASYILSLLYNERMGVNMSEAVHNELYSLSAKGYKVLPKSAPKSITVEGAEYELSEAQQAAIRGSNSASQAYLEKLFTKEKYKKLSEEMKAEAVNYVYEIHYNMALEDALGIDRGNAVLISSVIGAENLAMLHVATMGLTSDTDKLGNAISGSKRQKVVAAINQLAISSEQKLLLICAKGYTLKDGDLRGLSAERAKKLLLRYILRMAKLNKQQKAELATLCGFKVKDGKIDKISLTA